MLPPELSNAGAGLPESSNAGANIPPPALVDMECKKEEEKSKQEEKKSKKKDKKKDNKRNKKDKKQKTKCNKHDQEQGAKKQKKDKKEDTKEDTKLDEKTESASCTNAAESLMEAHLSDFKNTFGQKWADARLANPLTGTEQLHEISFKRVPLYLHHSTRETQSGKTVWTVFRDNMPPPPPR